MEIRAVNHDQMLWDKTIKLAENCSFPAVQRLGTRMRNNDFADWERVIAAVEDGSVVGFCVLEEKGRIPENLDCKPFINFVFVDDKWRGQRISEKMIRFALDYAKELGYKKVYLKSFHHGLYEKYGFTKIAEFEPVVGRANQLFEIEI